jgi:CRP/FNR family transcriptional regulator/CRP/FNR family cyclic AMP-dependent transcriptional regulator
MNSEAILEFAKKVPLFSNLSDKEVLSITSEMIVRQFSAGEVIVYEDENESQTFFMLFCGSVHIGVVSPEGKQTILATLRKGDFFGEMAILEGEPRSATVSAAEDCTLFMLYRRGFMDILQRYPKMTIQMLVEMSRRLRRSNRQINTLSLMSVYGRVADTILKLAREQGERAGSVTVIPNRPTQQVIAEMSGTTRETVSRVLSQLQKKQLISIDKKTLVILDEAKLYF